MQYMLWGSTVSKIAATNLRRSAGRVPSLARRVKAKFNAVVWANPFMTPMAYPAPSVELCSATVSTTKWLAADCSRRSWYQSTSESLTKAQSERSPADRIPSATSSTSSVTSLVTSSPPLNNKARTSCTLDAAVIRRNRPERSSDSIDRRVVEPLGFPVDSAGFPVDTGSRAAVINEAMLAV